MLAHRQDVGQHLRRVEIVREPVVDRYRRVGRELLNDGLTKAAVLDRVVHPA